MLRETREQAFRRIPRNSLDRRVGPELGAAGTGSVDKMIARLNIEHFRQQLADEKDEAKRQVLKELLAKEEDKLRQILDGSPPERPKKE